MLTGIYRALLLFFSVVAVCHAEKPPIEETMKSDMEKSMRAICADQTALTCLGISEKFCSDSVKTVLTKCDHLFPKDAKKTGATDAYDQCIEKTLPGLFGVSNDKIQSCLGTGWNEKQLPVKSKVAVAVKPSKAQLSKHDIPIPVYHNATPMSHIAGKKTLESFAKIYGTRPLPAVMLATKDDITKVANYYRKHLRNFREYKLHNGVLFIEDGPVGFKMARDIKLYVSTPHVMIVKDTNDPKAPQGTRSKIDIAYRK